MRNVIAYSGSRMKGYSIFEVLTLRYHPSSGCPLRIGVGREFMIVILPVVSSRLRNDDYLFRFYPKLDAFIRTYVSCAPRTGMSSIQAFP